MKPPLPAGSIVVCPLSCVAGLVGTVLPSHVLSLLSPNSDPTPATGLATDRHLTLAMHDLTEPREGYVAPDRTLLQRLLAFGADWDQARPMLVHCWAGISRSTAASFIFACAGSPNAAEVDIALALRRAAPFATPNRLMVALADDILDRGGRMVDAVTGIGRGTDAFEGVPFVFPARFTPDRIEP